MCTSVQSPSTQLYSCISIIKAQRAHNNYKNIILKEPNENPQRAPIWARGPRYGQHCCTKCTAYSLHVLVHLTRVLCQLENTCSTCTSTYRYTSMIFQGRSQRGEQGAMPPPRIPFAPPPRQFSKLSKSRRSVRENAMVFT